MLKVKQQSRCACRRRNRLIPAVLIGIAVLLAPVWHADAQSNMLHSVRLETTQFKSEHKGISYDVTAEEPHFFIRFDSDEPFEFVIPFAQFGRTASPFFSEGETLFWYEDEEGFRTAFPISNRVLMTRNTLLAARRYYDGVCRDAGLTQTRWKPNEPIRVIFGDPDPTGFTFAHADFTRQRIVMRPDLVSDFDWSGTACHEYFHHVYYSVWHNGNRDEFFERYLNSHDPFRLYITEMTAEFSTDEPIQIRQLDRTIRNQDSVNDYLLLRNRHGTGFIPKPEITLFDRGEYTSCVLVKFLAEQIAQEGGGDTSRVGDILRMVKAMYDAGGIDETTFFQKIAEALPHQYWGSNWRDKWMKFYTALAASSLVQTANSREDTRDPLGFHDDAFRQSGSMISMRYDSFFDSCSKLPDKVYDLRAANDEERIERLKTLVTRRNKEVVRELAWSFKEISPTCFTRPEPPRPVFFYTKGEPGADVFLLRQQYPQGEYLFHRRNGTFSWKRDFTLLDKKPTAHQVNDFFIYPSFAHSNFPKQELWLGLVNGQPNGRSKFFEWSYFASPRLLSSAATGYHRYRRDSGTVRGTGGVFGPRDLGEPVRSGDEIKVQISSTGPLHCHGPDLQNIAPEHRSVKMDILGENNERVRLRVLDGRDMVVRLVHGPQLGKTWYTYEFSAFIDRDNPISGRCRLRFRLTSPLNLGEGDEQIDESFEFDLRDPRPVVERVQISHKGTVVYDSRRPGEKKPLMSETASYDLNVRVTFSERMRPNSTAISAGLASPYQDFRLRQRSWNDEAKVCVGSLRVPVSQLPSSAGLLRLSIAGQGTMGKAVDGDFSLPGDQPDTRHFLLLGIKEYYELSMTAQSRGRFFDGPSHRSLIQLGPSESKCLLLPVTEEYARRHALIPPVSYTRPDLLIVDFQASIRDLNRSIARLESEIEKMAVDPKKAADVALQEKRRMLERMQRGLEQRRGQMSRHGIEQVERAIAALEAEIRDRERNPANSGQVLKEKMAKLETQKKKHGFLRGQLPRVEALVRVASGYRDFAPRPSVGGPIQARFGSVTWEYHGDKYQGSPRERDIADDPSSLERRWLDPKHLIVVLRTVEFTAADMAKVDELLETDSLKEAWLNLGARSQQDHLFPWRQAVRAARHMKRDLWLFFPADQRPKDWPKDHPLSYPVLNTTRLLRLSLSSRFIPFRPEPVEVGGRPRYRFRSFLDGRNPSGARIRWRLATATPMQAISRGHAPFYVFVYPKTAVSVIRGEARGTSVTREWYDESVQWLLRRIGASTPRDPDEDKVAEEEPAPERAGRPPKAARDAAARESDRPLASATSYDPHTGITTHSQENADGSRRVTQTDRDGNVIKTERIPPAGEQLPSAEIQNPSTGHTISSRGNPDGSRLITRKDADGNIISQHTIKPVILQQ